MRVLLLIACFAFMTTAPVWAQDDSDLQRRMELAQKMHEIKPLGNQIEGVVEQMAERYPGDKKDKFKQRMLEVFDRETLTEISVKAMADTFTVAELEKMIDFHGSPEGKSISEKMPVYQALIEPELIKKIDQALMEIRTGSAGN